MRANISVGAQRVDGGGSESNYSFAGGGVGVGVGVQFGTSHSFKGLNSLHTYGLNPFTGERQRTIWSESGSYVSLQ